MKAKTNEYFSSLQICAKQIPTFTTDDIYSTHVSIHGESENQSKRAIGGAIISAVFAGLIEDSGEWQSTGKTVSKVRGKPQRIWISKIYEGPLADTEGATDVNAV